MDVSLYYYEFGRVSNRRKELVFVCFCNCVVLNAQFQHSHVFNERYYSLIVHGLHVVVWHVTQQYVPTHSSVKYFEADCALLVVGKHGLVGPPDIPNFLGILG